MKGFLTVSNLCLELLLISLLTISYNNKDIRPLYAIIPAIILGIILKVPHEILIKLDSIFIIFLLLIAILKFEINIKNIHLSFLIFFFFLLEFLNGFPSTRDIFIILSLFIGSLFILKNINIGNFFNNKSFILSVSAISIFFNRDIVIPFLVNRIIKFVHDIVHSFILLFLIPDHRFMRVNLWNFIGIIFGKKTDLIIAMVVILLPFILYIINSVKTEPPLFSQFKTSAERRKTIASFKRDKRIKTIPVIFSIIIIIISGYLGYSSQISIYDPEPIPVIDDGKGFIKIPVSNPTYTIYDRRMHKYIYNFQGEDIIFFVIMRPDNKIVSALDMCEICEPLGYSQFDRNVLICKYCKTHIPVNTIGKPGGCNPIPLKCDVTPSNIVISVDELISKYKKKLKGK